MRDQSWQLNLVRFPAPGPFFAIFLAKNGPPGPFFGGTIILVTVPGGGSISINDYADIAKHIHLVNPQNMRRHKIIINDNNLTV